MFVKIINNIRSKIQICVCSEKVVICKYKTVYSLQQQKCLHVRDIVYLTINSAEYCVFTPFPVHQVSAVLVNKPAAFLDLMNQSVTCTGSADWHLNLVTTNMVMCHRAVCIPDIRCYKRDFSNIKYGFAKMQIKIEIMKYIDHRYITNEVI